MLSLLQPSKIGNGLEIIGIFAFNKLFTVKINVLSRANRSQAVNLIFRFSNCNENEVNNSFESVSSCSSAFSNLCTLFAHFSFWNQVYRSQDDKFQFCFCLPFIRTYFSANRCSWLQKTGKSSGRNRCVKCEINIYIGWIDSRNMIFVVCQIEYEV